MPLPRKGVRSLQGCRHPPLSGVLDVTGLSSAATSTPKTSGLKKGKKTNWSGAVTPLCRPPRPNQGTRRLVTLRRRAPWSQKRRWSSGTATRGNCRKWSRQNVARGRLWPPTAATARFKRCPVQDTSYRSCCKKNGPNRRCHGRAVAPGPHFSRQLFLTAKKTKKGSDFYFCNRL